MVDVPGQQDESRRLYERWRAAGEALKAGRRTDDPSVLTLDPAPALDQLPKPKPAALRRRHLRSADHPATLITSGAILVFAAVVGAGRPAWGVRRGAWGGPASADVRRRWVGRPLRRARLPTPPGLATFARVTTWATVTTPGNGAYLHDVRRRGIDPA